MVDDDDVVAHDEVLVSTPRRIDLDQRRSHVDHPHTRRHQCSNAQREVDIIHPRHAAAGEDGLLNPRALLRGEIHAPGLTRDVGAGLTLLGLTLLRSLLGLALLTLRRLARGLTLLTGLTLLALLTLRRLTSGLIVLLALVRLLGLILLVLAGLTLLRSLLRPALLTLFTLVSLHLACGLVPLVLTLVSLRLAGGLIPLALAFAALLDLTLLALFSLALRLTLLTLIALALLRLARRLLALTALLRLTLLALILRSALLLWALLMPAIHLCAALGGAARLTAGFAARDILG
jgi:hypothetical protein